MPRALAKEESKYVFAIVGPVITAVLTSADSKERFARYCCRVHEGQILAMPLRIRHLRQRRAPNPFTLLMLVGFGVAEGILEKNWPHAATKKKPRQRSRG